MDFKRLLLFLKETGPLLWLSWKTGTASSGVMVLLLALELWNESMRVDEKGRIHLKDKKRITASSGSKASGTDLRLQTFCSGTNSIMVS
jgi:hypothetical protein